MSDEHSSFIKTPRQLVIVVVLAFAVPIALITLATQLITGTRSNAQEDERHVLERIQPVGKVVLAEAGAAKGSLTGEQVYGQICKACHEAGIAGAPKAGDKPAWAARIAQGENLLVQHAIAGFQGKTGVMPPKGGNPDLADVEVHRAVDFMANQAGASFKEPAPTAPAPTTTAAATAGSATPAAGIAGQAPTAAAAPSAASAAPMPPATSKAADGKGVFETTCAVCHGAGIAGAPKFGDKAAWAPRIAEGSNTLHQHAIGGFQGKSGVMPPKGGNLALSDAEVAAAVDYMVSAAK